MTATYKAALGLHFTDHSVTALFVGLDGRVHAKATADHARDSPAGSPESCLATAQLAVRQAAATANCSLNVISIGAAVQPDMLEIWRDGAALRQAVAQAIRLPDGTVGKAVTTAMRAHVPGTGVAEPSTMVLAMGDSAWHLLNSRIKAAVTDVAMAEGAILPAYFGYELQQVGLVDALRFVERTAVAAGEPHWQQAAADIPPGSEGAAFIVDFAALAAAGSGECRNLFSGLNPHHQWPHLARAVVEASAYWLRDKVERFRAAGVPCRRFVAAGALPRQNLLLMQIYADVLRERITIHPSDDPAATGAAVLSVVALGAGGSGFASASSAMRAMARAAADVPGREPLVIRPSRQASIAYNPLYQRYRERVH